MANYLNGRASNGITYLFTDMQGNRIEELPARSVRFTLALNTSGTFSGTLDVERLGNLNWIAATAPNLAQFWVDVGGTLVFGGIIAHRKWTQGSTIVEFSGSDHYSYLTKRLQAKDYSTTWATAGAGAAQIAQTVVADALAVAGSIPLTVSTPAATPSAYKITLSAPISQRMTVDSIMNQLSALGWQVGFDYAVDYAYVSGIPAATLTLSYPRRGRVAGTTGLVIDTASVIDFVYEEAGESQAMSVTETATGSGGLSASGVWTPAMTVDGYPLMERVGSHASFSSSSTPLTVLNAYVANDLALSSYPVVTPQITTRLFDSPSLGEWIVGDDFRVVVPKQAGGVPPQNPRFPNGMDFHWRLVKADCTISEAGASTVVYTFNIPPSSTPQRPPQ